MNKIACDTASGLAQLRVIDQKSQLPSSVPAPSLSDPQSYSSGGGGGGVGQNWQVAPSIPDHIPYLAEYMREADRREVWASHRHNPVEALETSLKNSELAWTFIGNDKPLFMWGVGRQGSILSDKGMPWLLGTDGIRKFQRVFLQHCPYYVGLMQESFALLENYVHADNRISIRWLEWCGFTVEREIPEVINDEDFYQFWRVK